MNQPTADVLLDTDIGSDVDDALALGVLLGSPEARIAGITTVYGDTLLRARLAHRLGALAGRDLTVVPGATETLSGKDVRWAGHEGRAFPDLEIEPVRNDIAADRFLVDTVLAETGASDLIAIAPLTNIARAIRGLPGDDSPVPRFGVQQFAVRTDRCHGAPVHQYHPVRGVQQQR